MSSEKAKSDHPFHSFTIEDDNKFFKFIELLSDDKATRALVKEMEKDPDGALKTYGMRFDPPLHEDLPKCEGRYVVELPKPLDAIDARKLRWRVQDIEERVNERCPDLPERQHHHLMFALMAFGGE